MTFTQTKLAGAYIVELEKRKDERGFFARAWCAREFRERGLAWQMVQANIAANRARGTLRGLHYQLAPHQEVKLVRCTKGAIFDVIIDLRPESDTYKQWLSVELTAQNNKLLYAPQGFAHGYQTLRDDTDVFYQVSEFYSPESERGIRWNDPAFSIQWPVTDSVVISAKDQNWRDYAE
jgi:dTDP-4-dehydrorhamnose 3,5-epimerase